MEDETVAPILLQWNQETRTSCARITSTWLSKCKKSTSLHCKSKWASQASRKAAYLGAFSILHLFYHLPHSSGVSRAPVLTPQAAFRPNIRLAEKTEDILYIRDNFNHRNPIRLHQNKGHTPLSLKRSHTYHLFPNASPKDLQINYNHICFLFSSQECQYKIDGPSRSGWKGSR